MSMNKLKFLVLFLLLGAGKSYAEELRPQYRTWKSSQIQCNAHSNVLISSTPIIFHMVTGSAAVNQGGTQYFSFFWSTRQPPTTDMSTKAFIPTNQSVGQLSGMGIPYDVVVSTTYQYHIYSYFSFVGAACPVMYEWDYYNIAPEGWYYNPKD